MRMFHRSTRRGLTLVELMMVSAVMAILATSLAALATTVQVSNEQQTGRGLALQHGQVVMQRIERALQSATTSEQFPGFIVVRETVSGSTFPDTLAVWKPSGQPVAPGGLPRVNELVVFTPAYNDPTRLIELSDSNNSSEVPAVADAVAWQYLISMMKMSAMSGMDPRATVLTDLLRQAAVTDSSGNSFGQRGCIRFEQSLRPSEAEWNAYKAGLATWQSLPWVQGIYGTSFGQRQACVESNCSCAPAIPTRTRSKSRFRSSVPLLSTINWSDRPSCSPLIDRAIVLACRVVRAAG